MVPVGQWVKGSCIVLLHPRSQLQLGRSPWHSIKDARVNDRKKKKITYSHRKQKTKPQCLSYRWGGEG